MVQLDWLGWGAGGRARETKKGVLAVLLATAAGPTEKYFPSNLVCLSLVHLSVSPSARLPPPRRPIAQNSPAERTMNPTKGRRRSSSINFTLFARKKSSGHSWWWPLILLSAELLKLQHYKFN